MLLLRDEDIEGLLTWPEAVSAVERALRHLARGEALSAPRWRPLSLPSFTLALMPAGLPVEGVAGFKWLAWGGEGLRMGILLLDLETGSPLALLQADRLNHWRTGAATALAARYLARRDAHTIAVLGSGAYARSQLEALFFALPLEEARVYSPNPSHREEFAREMTARLGRDVKAVASPAGAVRGAQVVLCATTSETPVFSGEDLAPGAFVVAMGAHRPAHREVDDTTVQRCTAIVVDDREQARQEAGDLLLPLERGLLTWDRVLELHQVVAGQAPGRRDDRDITLFKSLGSSLWDVAVGLLAYRRAREMGRGREVPFP